VKTKTKDRGPEGENLMEGFREYIIEVSGIDVSLCYQCRKCFTGCPLGRFMDMGPHVINRMIQYGFKSRVLSSSTIWLCASCGTCAVRCPNGIDIPKLMDILKQLALKEGGKIQESGIKTFHHLFLNNIRKMGRISEFGMVKDLKLHSGNLFKDIGSGIKLLFKGKMSLLSERIEGMEEIKNVFEELGGRE